MVVRTRYYISITADGAVCGSVFVSQSRKSSIFGPCNSRESK